MERKEVEKLVETAINEDIPGGVECAKLYLENEVLEKKHRRERFDAVKFLKGLFFNKYFIAWIAWFVLTLFAIGIIGNVAQPGNIRFLVIICLAGVTLIWMLSEAWKKFIERGELKVSVSGGATVGKTANTVANVADIINASKNQG